MPGCADKQHPTEQDLKALQIDSENPQDSSYDSQSVESELSGPSDGPLFMLSDIRQELEEAARQMPGSQKINMMFVDFSTP